MTKTPTIITKFPREGTHWFFTVYESWPPYLFACCFSGEFFIHDPIRCFYDDCLSTVGRAVAVVRCSQSRVKLSSRNHGEEICHDPCHAKFIAIAGGDQLPLTHHALKVPRYQILRVLNRLFFVFLLEAWTPPDGWSPRVLLGTNSGTFLMIVFIPRDNSCYDQAWSQQELFLGINSPGD